MNLTLTNKRKRNCLANTARLSYVWSANRQRITQGVQLEFMQLSQTEVADAYALDVTRLLSFRGYSGGLSMFTDRPQGFEDLRGLRDESSPQLLGSSEMSLHFFGSSGFSICFKWRSLIDSHARQFYRFCKEWQ